ncbi:MAG: AAA family ATPase [Saprospiraceae bacterium]|nr:AAA family ATPase [Saprospiraceae bacterium]
MTKVQKTPEIGKAYNEKNETKSLTVNDIQESFNENQSPILAKLLKCYDLIIEAANQDVVRRKPLISRYDSKNDDIVPIILQGTINIVQGKTGTHKSRFAELLCSLFLVNAATCNTDFLEFISALFPVAVVYIDTERGMKDEFPLTVQRIREKAGFDKTFKIDNFYPISIAKAERHERVEAVKQWLEYVQGQTSLPLFVVLDVVTDCVVSFNNDKDSLKLFDDLRNFADDCNATFLLLIHENPFSDKARGHTGTEGQNKASTIIQIGFNSDNDDNDLMKLRFLKTRNIAKPNPIFLEYSKEAQGLVLANEDMVKQQIENKRKAFDTDLVIEYLEQLLTDPKESKEVSSIQEKIAAKFKKGIRAAQDKLLDIINQEYILRDLEGEECKITREKDPKDKRRLLLKLALLNTNIQTELPLDNVQK